MKIGTKSILFGVHCFVTHPFFTAYSWYKLYGFPYDPRLWVAFFVHDLGYWGKPNMDGSEGEKHVELGAAIMGKLFGKKWYNFTIAHSRFYAKKKNLQYSQLCVADKATFYITWRWLYKLQAYASGEIHEYLSGKGREVKANSFDEWYDKLKIFLIQWVKDYKEIKEDKQTVYKGDNL